MLTKAQQRVLALAAASPITPVETIVMRIRSDVLERLISEAMIRYGRGSGYYITRYGRAVLQEEIARYGRKS